jgi:hypothetical protein
MVLSAIQFLTPDAPWSSNAPWGVVYSLNYVFCFFKGRDPLKKILKSAKNVDEYKAYPLVPLKPYPSVPLDSTFKTYANKNGMCLLLIFLFLWLCLFSKEHYAMEWHLEKKKKNK